jgi:hypothetical protein
MKQKQPKHCKNCPFWHNAGHKEGTPLEHSKYNNWCCRFATHAPKAVSVCIVQGENRNDRRNSK